MITTITGTNTYLVRARLDEQVADFVNTYGDLGLEKIDADEATYERITEALQSIPFLAEKKLVVIKNPGAQKQLNEQFADLLPTIPDSTDVILVETKPDKRTSFYKTLKNDTNFYEYDELREQELPRWLSDEAKVRGGSLSQSDASYLVGRLGANQLMLSQELDKLLLYKADITREQIDLLTEPVPQSTIFELIDAAFSGNHKKSIALYREQRSLRVEPQQIMAMLAWQLHVLAVVKTAEVKSSDEIAKVARLNPFVVRKSQNITRNLSIGELKRLAADVLALDIKLKSQNIDADEALEYFLLTIS